MIDCIVINKNTGEILADDFKIDTMEDKKRRRSFAKKKVEDDEFKSIQNKYLGSFVFFIYKNMGKLSEILTDVELVRYVYLGTYVKSDGFLKEDNNKTKIDKKHMKKILQMNDTTLFNKFFNKLIENELIYVKDDFIKINVSYFYSGYEKDYQKLTGLKLDEDFTRIYIDATRKLYENTENRKKKQLHIVYKLLPFVNWKYNILCYNPSETDKEKIELLTIGDVMDVLGYSKNQLARFKKDFYTIPCGKSTVFLSVQRQPEFLESIVAVNPKIYYKGKDTRELEYLITLFGINNR